MELGRASDRDRTSREVYADVRRAVAGMAGIDVTVNPVQGGPPVGKDIQLQLSSSNRGIMEEACRIRYYLENQMTGLRDVEDTLPLPGIEWELVVDRGQKRLCWASIPCRWATWCSW